MSKKPRSDSKLDSLPDHQWAELRDQLLAGGKYESALAWLSDECGVSSSFAALSGFYKRHCVPVMKERRQFAALKAETLIKDAGLTDWDAAILERLRQMVFEMMSADGADAEDISRMFKLVLKSQDQELHLRKVKMLEEQAQEVKDRLMKTVKSARATGMTEDTIREIEETAGIM